VASQLESCHSTEAQPSSYANQPNWEFSVKPANELWLFETFGYYPAT